MRIVTIALLVGALLFVSGDCLAAKRVKLEFEPGWAPSGVDEGSVQSQVVQRFQNHFGFAGANMYVFTNCNTTSFDKKVVIKDDRHAPDDWVVGKHAVCASTNYVYGGTFKSAFNNTPAMMNSTSVARVIARTAAHEVGHHWGQDHPPNDHSNTTNLMGRPGLGARVNTDAGFSSAQKTEMASYINSTKNKADAGGGDQFQSIATVFGEYEPTTGDIGDDAEQFTALVEVEGDISAYEIGWMNPYGVFVPKIQPGIATDAISMFCGYQIDFALRDPVTEEIFTASAGHAVLGFENPIPPEVSSCPVVQNPYYATAHVDFPAQGVFITLDTLPTNPTCGFIIAADAQPETSTVREWGILILAVLLIGYAAWRLTYRFRTEATSR